MGIIIGLGFLVFIIGGGLATLCCYIFYDNISEHIAKEQVKLQEQIKAKKGLDARIRAKAKTKTKSKV